jgi:hypothetical protein
MTLGIRLQLATGREVRLAQLHLLPCMIDWADSAKPKVMVDRLPQLVEGYFGTEIPWLVKNPRDIELPIACIALFESEPMVSHGVQVENSWLIVCWFTKSADQPIRNLTCEALAEIEWERHAKDFHSDW